MIDRDVFRALAEHTVAGRRVLAELKDEVYAAGAAFAAPGQRSGASRRSAEKFVDAVADALYTGRPNVASASENGKRVYVDLKIRLLDIVRKS